MILCFDLWVRECCENEWNVLPFGKFLRKYVSEDKVDGLLKSLVLVYEDNYWSWKVGIVIDPWSSQGWFSRSRKGLPTEGFDRWRVMTNKDVVWSAPMWSVVVCEPSRSWQSVGALQQMLLGVIRDRPNECLD